MNKLKELFYKVFKRKKTPCTITFIYDCKGVIGAGKNKKETVFAWVESGTETKDCVPLFNSPNIGRSSCTITDVIVLPIQTVIHESN